jgi:enoyl-CoA hydratase/carnithine racemase
VAQQESPAAPPPDRLAAAGLRLTAHGPLTTVTLARPDKRNAQDPGMWEMLAEIGRTLAADTRVVVVRGDGPSFSAGLDRSVMGGLLTETAALPQAECQARIEAWQQGFAWLRRPSIVSIAAVQGHAVGGGFQLALACDLRVIADDAQFTMAETSLGIVPDLGGTGALVEAVGYARALEICATARRVGAAEAAEIGLAQAVVALAELDGAVDDLVAAIVATPAEAVAATKALLAAAVHQPLEQQRAAEATAQTRRLRALAGLTG